MSSEDINKKFEEYRTRMLSADSVEEQIKIFGKLESYYNGIVDSMTDVQEKNMVLSFLV